MTFQRARTEEQREIRRRAILDTASAMLDEMPVAAVTLNELSRRVGLAKPNVLRYFESREAVLLELLDRYLREWLAELAGELAAGVDGDLPMAERATAVAGVLSRSLSGRVVLCDLFGAQAAVLEHNVSVEVVARYKRASLDRLATMADLVRKYLPELGESAALFGLQTMAMAGTFSAYSTPPPSLRAAYEAEPDLARFHLGLEDSLRLALTATLLGVLPRDRP
ncbi:TetR family transcriptional regulator [Nocardiopsis changdeensis]|uniref:TetR/AcrR family transcriptional regulator n=1 Tax=Nocardiopsis changdeensis TaxID=2831969 RepID=A0ABX8BIW4_9ACTN|nr:MULTISPECIES: TetR/AcrR family transcriptional regulator [Nocardiopsis]QUX20773.1 TetR/AcrR family transcriptional regulator [Nocardiopsis changdeensis]QYX36705.1 TetR/AcrR family transcriptional regulator [Nocardiopsis sp. MT53]